MGMFDTVTAECLECSGRIQFQSKADDCVLADYSEDSMPFSIARDIHNRLEFCESCGESFRAVLSDVVVVASVDLVRE